MVQAFPVDAQEFPQMDLQRGFSDVKNIKTILFQRSGILPTTIGTFLFVRSLGKLVQESCLSQTK